MELYFRFLCLTSKIHSSVYRIVVKKRNSLVSTNSLQCLNLRKNDMISVGSTTIERFRLAMKPFWVDDINRWLGHVESLSLDCVELDDRILEKVTLPRCTGLSDPQFSSFSHKCFQIDRSAAQKDHLESINLESFADNGSHFVMILNLPSLGKLGNISFANAKVHRNPLKALISKQHYLGSLAICYCEMNSFQIDDPNLDYFSFKGSLVDLDLKAQNILEADSEFSNVEYDDEFHTGLLRFLTQLDRSANLKLRVHSQEALTFSAEIRSSFRAPLPNVKEISVKPKEPSNAISEMEDSMRWMMNTKS